MKTRGILAFAVVTLVSLAAMTASAQAPTLSQPTLSDGRWTPYLGCWRLLAENVRDRSIQDLIQSAAQRAVTPAVTVCVRPSADASGVTMTTFAEGKKVLEQAIVADGAPHAVTESGCQGTQSSRWSGDGFRLFTRVDLACHDRPAQTISGFTLFAQGPAWVDIQTMNGDADPQVRIRRYARTFEQPVDADSLPPALLAQAVADAQTAAARKLSSGDVTEASARLPSQAVEAAIVETGSRFNLDSRALITLADAGVAPEVIDLMVAQSFPSHFRVERPSAPLLPPVSASMPTYGVPGAQYPTPYPVYPYGTYDPYYYYSYYYSPFAYPYYWGNNYFSGLGYYGGVGIPVIPGSGGNTGGGSVSQGSSGDRGQVVNGRGYTRVHAGSGGDPTSGTPVQQPGVAIPRTVRPAGSTGTATADSPAAAGSTTSGSSSSPAAGSSSSGSSSSGGVSSSGGYSNGGSGDTGRTAHEK